MRRIVPAHVVAAITLLLLSQQTVVAIADGQDLLPWGLPIALLSAVTATAGWLIAWRRPREALGWILLAIPMLLAVQGPATALAAAVAPSSAAAASWLQ